MKPRNHIVLAMIRSNKSGGVHSKSNKAVRRSTKVKLTQDQRGSHKDGK
jgi:hypothetical protein